MTFVFKSCPVKPHAKFAFAGGSNNLFKFA